MPIANCIVSLECHLGSGNLIDLWSGESGISSEHMTVNMLASTVQYGNQYKVMATLLLPSMWPQTNIDSLQVGLAKALAQFFELSLQDVHVVTRIVESGLVVEDGEVVCW